MKHNLMTKVFLTMLITVSGDYVVLYAVRVLVTWFRHLNFLVFLAFCMNLACFRSTMAVTTAHALLYDICINCYVLKYSTFKIIMCLRKLKLTLPVSWQAV